MNIFRKKRIFLDFAAGRDNPTAIYKEGEAVRQQLEHSRVKVARVLQVQARDIIFTSGGTESDNFAVLGVFEALRREVEKRHIVVSSIEHPAILECAKEIERRGGEVTIVHAEQGVVDAAAVLGAVRENTVLVSVMFVNNETGAIQPISRIARLLAEYKKKSGKKYPYFHTDASQAASMLPVDLGRLGVDLMTLDASKVSGPKGVGMLVARPGVPLHPIIFGGGQERGLRGGTPHVAAIADFASALEVAQHGREKESERLTRVKNIFIQEVQRLVPQAVINTPPESVPSIVSLSFPSKLHEFLAIKLDELGVCVSTGSSCKNLTEEENEALRFSFGSDTTESEVREAVRLLSRVVV